VEIAKLHYRHSNQNSSGTRRMLTLPLIITSRAQTLTPPHGLYVFPRVRVSKSLRLPQLLNSRKNELRLHHQAGVGRDGDLIENQNLIVHLMPHALDGIMRSTKNRAAPVARLLLCF
jgi:hypothetical protein